MGSLAAWRGFPLAFFGYGFLYAWGYVSWSTDSLATQSVSGGEFDLSWLVSAALVPAALVVLALLGRRLDLEHARGLYLAAPVLAAVGMVLSVAYQHVGFPWLSGVLAVASGVGTGCASALFGLLWSLALARLNMEALEVVVPASFAVSALCAVVAPSLPQVPALVVALLLVALCAASLVRCRLWLAGQGSEGAVFDLGVAGVRRADPHPWLEDCAAASGPSETTANIVRMLAFGVVAWAVMNMVPVGDGSLGAQQGSASGGVDLMGALGYVLATALALLIIRYAVRVDFQALAFMTLPVLVLSMTLFAFGFPMGLFAAGTLNVALNSCCEIILLLYFIRIAQGRGARRSFWLALGSAASYLGVFLGQLADGLLVRTGVVPSDPSLFCLAVVCVYVFATLLIPQRSYRVTEVGPARFPQGAAGRPSCGACARSAAIWSATAQPEPMALPTDEPGLV